MDKEAVFHAHDARETVSKPNSIFGIVEDWFDHGWGSWGREVGSNRMDGLIILLIQ